MHCIQSMIKSAKYTLPTTYDEAATDAAKLAAIDGDSIQINQAVHLISQPASYTK